jgi:LDH2 family malate/lactate/ureidoglycolate dehydrogenase
MKINRDDLYTCAIDVLLALGESPENAKIAAENFCQADSRGVITHGTYLLTPIFERVQVNQLSLPTTPTIVCNEAAVAIVDGGDGLGPVAGKFAVDLAVKRASQFGISLVLIRNTNNVGSLSFYTEMIARQGMVGMMSCTAAPAMAPWGATEAFTGTNPIAVGIYTGKDVLFSADMATSVVARGKIRNAVKANKPIPADWALDSEGNPTTDPVAAMSGTLMPMGGPKGSALALAVDILSGIIAGGEHAPNIKTFHTPSGKTGVGASIAVIDIQKFTPLPEFATTMDDYVQSMKGMKKAKGASEIFLPGEIEQRREVASRQNGIELDEKAVAALNQLLEKVGSSRRLETAK